MTFIEVMNSMINKDNNLEQLAKQYNLGYPLTFLQEIKTKIIYISEVHLDFLDEIPNSAKNEVAQKLLEEILIYHSKFGLKNLNETTKILHRIPYRILDYKTGEFDMEHTMLSSRTPKEAIKKDLKTAKAFGEMLWRIYYNTNGEFTHEDLTRARKMVATLISDLENGGEGSIIHKQSYYEDPLPSKTPIKKFLLSVIKKYNIRTAELHSKQFIDSI